MGLELPIREPMIEFTVLAAVALAVSLTLERWHVPGVIGLLIAGMAMGTGGAGLVAREPVAELFGQIGLVYIMFLAGMEIDLGAVRAHQAETALFGVLAFGCSFGPAFVAGLLLGLGPAAAALFGTLLASHTLLAYPVVLRLGLTNRRPVLVAVGGTVVTDTLALVLLAIVIQAAGRGGAWGWMVPLALLGMLVAASAWAVPWLGRLVFRQDWITRPEKALVVLVALLGLATAAEVSGTDQILGAFLAGLCLNAPLREHETLREHVEFAGRMLFIPFFFLSTGMLVEWRVIVSESRVWALAGVMTAIVLAGKVAAAWVTGAWFGYPVPDRALMAALTVPQAAATLAVTTIARDAGLFGTVMVDAVIVLILVTCLVGPLATQYFGRRVSGGPEAPDDEENRAPAGLHEVPAE